MNKITGTPGVPITAPLPTATPQAVPSSAPSQPEPSDSVSVSRQPAVTVPEKPAAPPPVEPVETPPVSIREWDPHEVIDFARTSPLGHEPALDVIEHRWNNVPGGVRDGAAEHLLDLATHPDVPAARKGLSELAEGMSWAQRFKNQATKAQDTGGIQAVMAQARAASVEEKVGSSSLDEVLRSPSLLRSGKLGDRQTLEANSLIAQLQGGNSNPGIGTKTLGKGICYLRGREGTRVFYRMKEGRPEFLAVVHKGDEPATISMLRQSFDLR